MKASLVLNHKNQIAFFYTVPFTVVPEWASVDVAKGELFIGGKESEGQRIKLEHIDTRIYERVKTEPKILLVRVKDDQTKDPLEALSVPLMIPQQL